MDAATDLYLFNLKSWRLRATALTRLIPDVELDALQLSAERSIGLNKLLRFGLSRQFSQSASSTTANASLWARGKLFDLSLNADYDFDRNSFRIGGRLAFGFIYDPLRGSYVMTKPGAATAGSIALNAYRDLNGDGVRQPQEPGIENLSLSTGSAIYSTDDRGHALAPVVGTGLVPVKVTSEQADDPLYFPEDLKFRAGARPGRVMKVDYPVAHVSEVMVRAVQGGPVDVANGTEVSGLKLALVSKTGKRFAQTTADDGGAYFTDLPPGNYALELDQDQARELGATLKSPVSILAPAEGGQLLPADAVVNFENDQSNASKG